ncbi:hypothetical protein X754_26275 [Mesorhizobium sp. LNJC403B00]|nr:hypothetical protein X754_26275 [Mesorhizobium sp. LNJC403B00]
MTHTGLAGRSGFEAADYKYSRPVAADSAIKGLEEWAWGRKAAILSLIDARCRNNEIME